MCACNSSCDFFFSLYVYFSMENLHLICFFQYVFFFSLCLFVHVSMCACKSSFDFFFSLYVHLSMENLHLICLFLYFFFVFSVYVYLFMCLCVHVNLHFFLYVFFLFFFLDGTIIEPVFSAIVTFVI